MQKENDSDVLSAFRMVGTIAFTNPINKESMFISLGGYKMEMAGLSIMFDFEEYSGTIDEVNPCLLHFECKNPDYECFEDLKTVTKQMLQNVTKITRFGIDIEESNGSGGYLDEPTSVPFELKELSFLLPYENWETINVPEAVFKNICLWDSEKTEDIQTDEFLSGFEKEDDDPVEIVEAQAEYTAGNIYIYYGKLSDGNFFRTGDGEACIEIVDADASTEAADYLEFYEKHRVKTLTGEEYVTFWNQMLNKIITENKDGNYVISDLEKRLINDYLLKIAYSWGDEESDQQYSTFEEAWEEAKRMALEEAEMAGTEHNCEIGLYFDKANGLIQLHYTYDNEYCRYNVVKK